LAFKEKELIGKVMKIMYLTAEGFDTPNPNNQLVMTMLDDFLSYGIGVYLVQSHKTGTYDDIPNCLKDKAGLTYDIIQRPVINKTNFIKRYLDELKYLWRAKKRWEIGGRDVDLILLQSNPTSVFYIFLLKHILKKPIVYSVFDIFPGSAYEIGVVKQRWVYQIFYEIQKLAYRWSSIIVVPGDDMKDTLTSIGVPEYKICVIPNWYDDRSVSEIKDADNRFFQENNIEKTGQFIVQFAGTLGYVLDFQTIIDVAELLKNDSDIVFHIIGDGNMRKRYFEKIKQSTLTNIKTFPWQRIEIIQDVYSGCDVCLIPLKRGVIETGFPSKSTLLMACRRVVISSVPENTKYYQMINNNNIGIAVPIGQPQKLAEVIRYLRNHPEQITKIENKAQEYSKKYFSRTCNVPKFIHLFEELCASEVEKNV